MALSLKELKAKMVPASAKGAKDIDDQYLKPASYDKKVRKEFELDPDNAEVVDIEHMHGKFDNFKAQDLVKKNTKAPLREDDLQEISSKTLNSYIDGAMDDQKSASLSRSSNSIKNNKKFGSTKEIRAFVDKRQRGIDKAEDSLERKESINNLYKKLGLNKLVKESEEGPIATKSVGGGEDIKVNLAYEDEALELLEEITDLVERLEFDHGYFWQDVASHLKSARNCLLRQPMAESTVVEMSEDMLEEAFKRGNFKLRDGSQVKLTKEDVEALNAAVAGTKNATKLVNEITENQKEFTQFLSFAKKLEESFDDIIDDFLSEATEEHIKALAEGEDVDLHEIWAHAKTGASLGAVIGKNVGSIAGAAYGGAVGGAIGASVGAAKKAPKIKDLMNKWNGRKDDQPTPEKPIHLGHVKEDKDCEKESVLGTSAPAMDSDKKKKKEDLQ